MELNSHTENFSEIDKLNSSAPPIIPVSHSKPVKSLIFFILSLLLLLPAFSMFKPASLVSLRASLAIKSPLIQLDNEEGALLFQAREMKIGNSIYHALDNYPYVVGTYTPGFMWFNSLFLDIKNPNFESGRIMVWGATLGIGFILSLIVMLRERNVAAAILCPILFLATYEVHDWVAYYRVDFPAIFFSLLGFLIYLVKPHNLIAQIVAAFFMILGLYTKQTVIAVPLAALIYLLNYDRKQFLRFSIIVTLLGLVPFLITLYFTNGEFYNNIIKYNMNTWNSKELVIWWQHIWRTHKWLFLAGVVSLSIYPIILYQNSRNNTPSDKLSREIKRFIDPIWLYAITSLLNYFAIAKAGSAPNYLLEPLAAWSLLSCITISRCLNSFKNTPGFKSSFVPLCYSFVLLSLYLVHSLPYRNPQFVSAMFNSGKNPDRADVQIFNFIQKLVNKETDSYSETPIFNIRAGRSIYFQPFIMSELARQKIWDQSQFVSDIETGRFPIVISHIDLVGAEPTNLYTTEMLKAFRNSYKVIDTIAGNKQRFYILKPKDVNEKNKIDTNLVSMLNET